MTFKMKQKTNGGGILWSNDRQKCFTDCMRDIKAQMFFVWKHKVLQQEGKNTQILFHFQGLVLHSKDFPTQGVTPNT